MTTIKSYTDLNQSRKLAEILSPESADMVYIKHSSSYNPTWEFNEDFPPMILGNVPINEMTVEVLPCWSLAALFDVLPEIIIKNYYDLQKENSKYFIVYLDDKFSCTADNPVDACYEMILKLNEHNLL